MRKSIFETKYTATNGQSTIIPLNPNWKAVGVQLSGGLDSALLLYLTTKTIKENNLDVKILPFSIEVPSKAKNLSSARKIISVVSDLLDAEDIILPGKELFMPEEKSTHKRNKKNMYFNREVKNLLRSGEVDFEFNGNTKNPPSKVRKKFINNKVGRMRDRDARTSIYNGTYSASPHAMIDKQGIISLYIKHDLIDILATHTLSCDANISDIIKFQMDIPCGKCWWCNERKWGFESNKISDPAPVLPKIW